MIETGKLISYYCAVPVATAADIKAIYRRRAGGEAESNDPVKDAARLAVWWTPKRIAGADWIICNFIARQNALVALRTRFPTIVDGAAFWVLTGIPVGMSRDENGDLTGTPLIGPHPRLADAFDQTPVFDAAGVQTGARLWDGDNMTTFAGQRPELWSAYGFTNRDSAGARSLDQ